MHKVSEQTVQLTQKHAEQSFKHGKLVEDIGLSLQGDDHTKQELGQHIEDYGETIQKQAQEFLEKAQRLTTEDNSTEVFSECVQEHINATQTHIEAVREFKNAMQTHLYEVQKTEKPS